MKTVYRTSLREEIVSTIRNNGIYVGEMDAQEFWDTVMNPETRMLKQIVIEDAEKAAEAFEGLMGNNIGYRKDFISKNAYKAEIDI